MNKHFWQFRNISKTKGELILYGNIATYSWWEDDVTPTQFQKDLDALGNVTEIEVHINSPGGDVFAAQAIKSKLLQHQAKITTIVDGWAASAGTIVLMAGDVIQVLPGSMVMTHEPLMGMCGYYQVKDLDAVKNALIKVKGSIIETYQARTGKSKEALTALMKEETWMTASEAVKEGFADEIIHSNKLDIVKDHENVIVNGISFDMSRFKKASLPDVFLNTAAGEQQEEQKEQHEDSNKEDGEKMTKEELKNNYRDIYNDVLEEGRKAERERMQQIENVAMPGMDDLIKDAKYEDPITAEQLAVKIINHHKEKGTAYLNKRKEETPTDNGQLEPEDEDKKKQDDDEAAANEIANLINKQRRLV